MKYYDIQIISHHRYEEGNTHLWSNVINVEPGEYLKKVEEAELKASKSYYKRHEIFSFREISKQGFEDFEGTF